jgi:micrococcal nuclease
MSEIEELLNCDGKAVPYYTLDGHQYVCKCVRVYDGDTITVVFKPEGLNRIYKYDIRLSGIDTPELRSVIAIEKELAIQARDFVRERILGKIIKINCGKYDKYGRLLADVFELHNNRSLNDILVDQNYAYKYDGGKKNIWSPSHIIKDAKPCSESSLNSSVPQE